MNKLFNSCDNIIGTSKTDNDTLREELSFDQGCDSETLFKLARDFFVFISPVYKNKFETFLSTGKIQLEKDPEKAWNNSEYSSMFLTGNYADFIVFVHETTHNFSLSPPNKRSALSDMLTEVDAICMEILAIEYMKSQKNVDLTSFYSYRENGIVEDDSIKTAIKNFSVLLTTQKKEDISNIDSNSDYANAIQELFPRIKPSPWNTTLFRNICIIFFQCFAHHLGYILATYIHEKILENPDNIKMLEAVTQALSILDMEENKEEEAIKILSENGIPIVRDGKLSLDDENIKLLEDAFEKSHKRIKSYETEEVSHLSETAGQKPIPELVAEAINGIPDLTVLDEVSEMLLHSENGTAKNIISKT